MSAEGIPLPALLRAARGAYGGEVRRRLAEGGFDDLPRNGPFVLGGMANQGVAASDLIPQLGVSKQATGQLVDTLVLRGYLVRETNPDDRRRLDLLLTERGHAAAAEVRAAVVSVNERLARKIGGEGMSALRDGLVALIEIREEDE